MNGMDRRSALFALLSAVASSTLPLKSLAGTLPSGGGGSLVPFTDNLPLNQVAFDSQSLFYSRSNIENLHSTPSAATISNIVTEALPYLPSLLPAWALNGDGLKLALACFLAHEIRPYGSEVFGLSGQLTLERLLASSLLECRGYSDLTALMFKSLSPSSAVRLFHVAWRNSGFGGHNQIWAENVGAPNGMIVDATMGMIGTVSPTTFDSLRAGNTITGYRVQTSPFFGQVVSPPLQSVPLRPSNVSFFVDTSCYVRDSGELLGVGIKTQDCNVWFDRIGNAIYVLATSEYNPGAYYPRTTPPIFLSGGISEFSLDSSGKPYVVDRSGAVYS